MTSGKRHKDETQDQYRTRLKYENWAIKQHLQGIAINREPQPKRKLLSKIVGYLAGG